MPHIQACCIIVTQPGHTKHIEACYISHNECSEACCTSDTTWTYYEHYLAIRMKCCRICAEKPSTLGIIITRTGPLSTLKVGLFFSFFRGDILGLSGPLDFICSLYHADKVRKLHWLFFTLSFTTSSKSS